jgi:hypothetical protein
LLLFAVVLFGLFLFSALNASKAQKDGRHVSRDVTDAQYWGDAEQSQHSFTSLGPLFSPFRGFAGISGRQRLDADAAAVPGDWESPFRDISRVQR